MRAYDRDGKMFILSVNTAPLYEKNKVIGTVSFGRDITENKTIIETLKESEARYRNLVDSARDVIFTISSGGIITSLNPAFERVTGWPREQWLNKNFQQIIYPDDLPLVTEICRSIANREVQPSNLNCAFAPSQWITLRWSS